LYKSDAYTHRNGNGNAYCYRGAKVYANAQAASHTATSAVSSEFSARFLRGLAKQFASPGLILDRGLVEAGVPPANSCCSRRNCL
jgi:hypothetical protein